MAESTEIFIPAQIVRSLCWVGDELIDWVGGGVVYSLDETASNPYVNYAFNFDSAVVSPSGRYAAIYTRLGTKALLLDRGQILRELNRSFYHANVYEYPIVLFQLPDGREVIAHCPEEYNVLQIDEIESGKNLTERDTRDAQDFFHSRLTVNPGATKLLSAGWKWHPYDEAVLFDLERVFHEPSRLDHIDGVFPTVSEISSVAFLSAAIVAISSYSDAEDWGEDNSGPRLKPGTVAVYDVSDWKHISVAPVHEEVGTMMPVGTDHVVGFYEYPKLIHLESGQIVHRWPQIKSGKQLSSIIHHVEMPPIALDPVNRRFAVAGEDGITVIML